MKRPRSTWLAVSIGCAWLSQPDSSAAAAKSSDPAAYAQAAAAIPAACPNLKAMADAEGFRYEETLTGFKWIGNRALDMVAEGFTVLFSFEEAIGFCVGSTNVDKDGLSSAAVMAELVQYQAAEVCSVWD